MQTCNLSLGLLFCQNLFEQLAASPFSTVFKTYQIFLSSCICNPFLFRRIKILVFDSLASGLPTRMVVCKNVNSNGMRSTCKNIIFCTFILEQMLKVQILHFKNRDQFSKITRYLLQVNGLNNLHLQCKFFIVHIWLHWNNTKKYSTRGK